MANNYQLKIMSIIDQAVNFVKEVRSELGKVTFLKRDALVKYTIAVIAISILFSFFLGGVDAIFDILIKKVILGN